MIDQINITDGKHMTKYMFLEHTADVLFRAYGDDLNELFENAAEALESVMIDLKNIDLKEVKHVDLSSDSYENLLFDWLSEILVLFEVDSFAVRKSNVKLIDKSLSAECSGERVDKRKHKLKVEVKAVTYHNLEIMRDVRYYVDVTLDV
jgi:SHS2 domain-containing protein